MARRSYDKQFKMTAEKLVLDNMIVAEVAKRFLLKSLIKGVHIIIWRLQSNGIYNVK